MIFRNGKLVTQVFKTILKGRDLRIYDSNGSILRDINQTVLNFKKETDKKIGAIYKGSQLVWLTVYDAVRSCFGSGTWLQDRPWLKDDSWKNN